MIHSVNRHACNRSVDAIEVIELLLLFEAEGFNNFMKLITATWNLTINLQPPNKPKKSALKRSSKYIGAEAAYANINNKGRER